MQAYKYLINKYEAGRKGGWKGKDNPKFLLLVSYSKFLQDLPLDNIQQIKKKGHNFVKGI